ncbi:SCO3374 family protein [Streptomyces sp. NPDC052012]|uniref:SCO3374 family protein n=1 Tax=Streptomyces sp. NPDC052012 TaxID=3155051 RepID=UPI00344ECA9E
MAATVPLPRRPIEPGAQSGYAERVRHWYENGLGWRTVPGDPPLLLVGARFDVLDVPAEAGHAALRRLGALERPFPVAVQGDRMRLLVAAGSAEELPGLLEWLEWGAVRLDLVGMGAGGVMDAPVPGGPDAPAPGGPGRWPVPVDLAGQAGALGRVGPVGSVGSVDPCSGSGLLSRAGSQGAAVWLRPPEPGCEVEASLPTLSATGGHAGVPDLMRVVNTVATQCHRVRLRRACGPAAGRTGPVTGRFGAGRTGPQPLAFS